LAPVTALLIAANVLIFVLTGAGNSSLALWPLGTLFAPWQLLTYAFLHGSFSHLFFNMFGLYMFGSELERTWGALRFLVLYFASVLTAAVTQLAWSAFSGSPYPTVGASGGVFGVLLAYAVLFPRRKLMLLFPPIPMPAWLFVTLYGLAELVFGVTGTQSGVAHFAHLGGMLGGFFALAAFRRRNL